jgi:WD40 repeat protein
MRQAPFMARDFPVHVRTFLYACAFWAVAADEELKPPEQAWLVDQFGEEGATRSLDEFVSLESTEFFRAFDRAVARLTDADKLSLYPQLENWLFSCISTDERQTGEELEIVDKIRSRLSLDAELRRLAGHRASGPRSVHSSSVEGKTGRLLSGHQGEVTTLDLSADGRLLASGSEDATVRVWNLEQGQPIQELAPNGMGIATVAFCHPTARVVCGDRAGTLTQWEAGSGALRWECRRPRQGGITALAVHPVDGRILLASNTGWLAVHDAETGHCLQSTRIPGQGAIQALRFSRDGALLVSGGDDRIVRFWNPDPLTETRAMRGHTDGIMSVDITRDATLAVSGARDNDIRVWNVATGRPVTVLKAHTFTVYCVRFCADPSRVLSASWDHTLRLWNAETAGVEAQWDSIDARFNALAIHPSGCTAYAGGSDRTIRELVIG